MIRLHNTLSNSLEEFNPIDKGRVKMFVCGPTVYDYSHLGHAKTYTQFDVIARSFRYLGENLYFLVNITDIDDKIISRAKERGISPQELALEYEKYFLEDMQTIGVASIDKYARATGYIEAIVSQVKRLVDKGYAYKITDGYYFDIQKFEAYGKLSGRQSLEADDSVSRIDENPEKKNAGDFCLWKFKKEGDPSWDTEIGEGRPGWHIEDTAITESELGEQYDIHGGARDLIFPHHEAEIAQMEAVSGKEPFVRYWLHTGFLNFGSEKMSKSKGNFTTIREAVKSGIPPLALRYYFLGVHYRSPMNFTDEALEGAVNAYRKLKEFVSSLPEGGNIASEYKKEFSEALSNDFNTPDALAVVWKVVKDGGVSAEDKRATLLDFDQVLGLNLTENEFATGDIPEEVEVLLVERNAARIAQNWDKADQIREKIRSLGFDVKDTEEGQKLSKV
jgi:cysteinyl-tRNA synthetase